MIISVVNQKGGTGKTTTTVNLGKALTDLGYRVMLIDMDPQGNLSYSMAINQPQENIGHVISRSFDATDIAVEKEEMMVLPSDSDLNFHEFIKSDNPLLLKEALEDVINDFDFILIDCPPTLSSITYNALSTSSYVLVPMQLDVFSIQGLSQIIRTVEDVRSKYNDDLSILGVLPAMVDHRKKLTSEVLEHVKDTFDVYVFNAQVRTNVKAAEAPSFGISVIEYAPQSNSAKDYKAVAKEFIELLKANNKIIKTKRPIEHIDNGK